MKTLIEKLENRKKITGKALEELFKLILELEKNLDEDITTSDTSCKVNIKAEDYFCGSWLQSDDNFSLCILDGKITIKDIFTRTKKDENGEITTIYATYDEESKSGSGTEASMRKVKGTLHWVSAKHALPIEVRIYDRLFTHEQPDAEKETDFMEFVNKDSLKKVQGFAEPSLKNAKVGDHYQFQRIGYFTPDKDSTAEQLVFNRTVTLKDSFNID